MLIVNQSVHGFDVDDFITQRQFRLHNNRQLASAIKRTKTEEERLWQIMQLAMLT